MALADNSLGLTSPSSGPRDLVWVNARDLTWWLRLNKGNASLYASEKTDSKPAVGFLPGPCDVMMDALLEKAGPVDSMKLADKIYLLSALDELYQYMGDIKYLNKAGEIAKTFPADVVKSGETKTSTADKADSWFDPKMLPMLPDLALALHYYGWRRRIRRQNFAARYITEHAVKYATAFSDLDQARLAYARKRLFIRPVYISQ